MIPMVDRSLLRRPWLIDVANRMGAWLESAGMSFVTFDEEDLCRRACAETGLEDFGEESFREPLRVLLEAYRTEARLTLIGKLAAWHDTLRLLTNRLRLFDDRKRFPAIGAETVRAPVFIVGLPRTGSTLLHNLFAQDPVNRVPRTWEVMLPSPPPDASRRGEDPRVEQTRVLLRRFEFLAPTFKVIHPMQADWPTECVGILSHTFVSSQFQSTYHIPSYQRWLTTGDLRGAYEFHRWFLQHLQWRSPGERWVLKAPSHLFALDAVLAVYPDARFIHTHRDPRTVIGSTASLDTVLRYAFSNTVDPHRIGREALDQWGVIIDRVLALREELVWEHRFVDLRYDELVRTPIAAMETLYARLGWALSSMARQSMERYLSAYPKDRHGTHRYTLAQFGLKESEVQARFRRYCQRFGLETAA